MSDAVTNQTPVSFENTAIAFSHFDDKELRRAYRLFRLIDVNFLTRIGPPLVSFALKIGLPVTSLIRKTIFNHFCGGETIAGCEDNILHLARYRVGTILDYSVEGKNIEDPFDSTLGEILDTISRAKKDNNVPFTVFKLTGMARFGLLEKLAPITAGGAGLSAGEEAEFGRVKDRVDRICREAAGAGVRVLIDAEESWIQDTIDRLALDMMRRYNREQAIVYNTYQLYRHDRLAFLEDTIRQARSGDFYLGAKLVRGAYMEKERDRAEEKGYPSPIQPDKASADRDFDAAVQLCVEHLDRVAFMAGTHNEASCMKLVQLMHQQGIRPGDERIYFSQLLGMSDNISFNLADAGYRVAKYMPYGPVKSVLPYLFRRARENTAIAGQTGRELSLIIRELKRRRGQSN